GGECRGGGAIGLSKRHRERWQHLRRPPLSTWRGETERVVYSGGSGIDACLDRATTARCWQQKLNRYSWSEAQRPISGTPHAANQCSEHYTTEQTGTHR